MCLNRVDWQAKDSNEEKSGTGWKMMYYFKKGEFDSSFFLSEEENFSKDSYAGIHYSGAGTRRRAFGLTGGVTYKLNVENTAVERCVTVHQDNMAAKHGAGYLHAVPYSSGFHIYTDKYAASAIVDNHQSFGHEVSLVKVQYEQAHTLGIQDNTEVIVARKMKILGHE